MRAGLKSDNQKKAKRGRKWLFIVSDSILFLTWADSIV
jgi:hypothetical protein